MTPGELVVDVEQPFEKVAPVEPEHGVELVITSPASLVGGRECLLDLGAVEAVGGTIALGVRELEAVRDGSDIPQALIQAAARVLKTFPERELVPRISREELVAAGAGKDHLVATFDLRQQIVERED